MATTKTEDPTDILVMSVPEAGRMLGCARNKAYQLAQENFFPVLRLRGRLVVPRERFLRWLNEEVSIGSQSE